MKAIIPVAGVGTRLRPHTNTTPKVLIQVAGKPILGHILDKLAAIGIKQIVLVVGYMGDQVVNYVKEEYNFEVEFVEQKDLLGLGHAIYLTKDYVEKEDSVLIILGDTVFDAKFDEVISSPYTFIGVKGDDITSRFGIVEMENSFVKNLVEKPDNPASNLAIVGIYYIHNVKLLFNSLDSIIKTDVKTKGEYQLTDALVQMLKNGEKMKVFFVDGWFDCGKPETLLETNQRLLEFKSQSMEIEGSIILPPVYIAQSASIENAIVGPYVSIGENSIVSRSIIRNSIINKQAVVRNVILNESIVGTNSTVSGKIERLNVGDYSQVEFG